MKHLLREKNDMKKCIIHAGLHKTGTTYIQEFFHQNRLRLLPHGINYFNCQNRNHSPTIYSLYTKNPENYAINRNKGVRTKEQAAQLNQKLSKIFFTETSRNSSPFFLISGEGISQLHRGELSRLRNDISSFFDAIEIVLYLRSPHSWLTSLSNHRIGDGLDLHGQQGNLLSRYPLRETIEKMIAVFGRGRVNCRHFPPRLPPQQNIALDFLSVFKIAVTPSDLRFPPRLNESFSVESLNILGRIYRNRPDLVRGDGSFKEKLRLRNIRNMLRHVGQTRYTLSEATVGDISIHFHDDLQWLKENFSIEFEHAPSPTSQPEHPTRLESQERALAAILLKVIAPSSETNGLADDIESLSLQLNLSQSLKPEFYHHLGLVMRDAGNLEESLKAFANALELDPEHAQSHIESSNIYSEINNQDKAIWHVNAALELNNESPGWHCHLGKLLLKHGHLKNAEAAFLRSLELDADHEASRQLLSQLCRQKKPIARVFAWLNGLRSWQRTSTRPGQQE